MCQNLNVKFRLQKVKKKSRAIPLWAFVVCSGMIFTTSLQQRNEKSKRKKVSRPANTNVRGIKRPGCGVDYPPPYRAKVKERVEQYTYSPFGPTSQMSP